MIKKEITDLVSEKLNLNESNVMSALRLLEEGELFLLLPVIVKRRLVVSPIWILQI